MGRARHSGHRMQPYGIKIRFQSGGSARRSGHRMQPYGIKIRFQSGCSAGVARVVRDDEAVGSNPITPTNYCTNCIEVVRFYSQELPEPTDS